MSSEGAFRGLRKKIVLQTGVSEFVVPYSEPWSFESSNVNSPDFSQKASWVKEDAIFNPSSQPKVVSLSDVSDVSPAGSNEYGQQPGCIFLPKLNANSGASIVKPSLSSIFRKSH